MNRNDAIAVRAKLMTNRSALAEDDQILKGPFTLTDTDIISRKNYSGVNIEDANNNVKYGVKFGRKLPSYDHCAKMPLNQFLEFLSSWGYRFSPDNRVIDVNGNPKDKVDKTLATVMYYSLFYISYLIEGYGDEPGKKGKRFPELFAHYKLEKSAGRPPSASRAATDSYISTIETFIADGYLELYTGYETNRLAEVTDASSIAQLSSPLPGVNLGLYGMLPSMPEFEFEEGGGVAGEGGGGAGGGGGGSVASGGGLSVVSRTTAAATKISRYSKSSQIIIPSESYYKSITMLIGLDRLIEKYGLPEGTDMEAYYSLKIGTDDDAIVRDLYDKKVKLFAAMYDAYASYEFSDIYSDMKGYGYSPRGVNINDIIYKFIVFLLEKVTE